MSLSRQFAPSRRLAYWLAGLISVCLSASLYFKSVMVNPDAICYLMSAHTLQQSSLGNAMSLCGQAEWPFYSVMIYLFAKYSTLSLLTSAFVLNALLTLISVLAFMAIIEKLGGNQRVLWLAAFVILTAHEFNSVREYIVRDHGFWAFFLVSLLFYLRFMRDQSWLNALGVGVSLMIAALFRVEGVVYFMILPWLVFMTADPLRTKIMNFVKLNMLVLAGVFGLVLWLCVHPSSFQQLGRLQEIPNQVLHGVTRITDLYHVDTERLVQYLLPPEAARDAKLIWINVLVVMMFWNVISNLTVLAAALFLYGVYAGVGKQFKAKDKLVWLGYTGLNLVICAAFFAERLFFSKRYLIALTLLFLLWVPFALNHLLQAESRRKHYLAYAAMLVMFVSSLSVLSHSQHDRSYVPEAGAWMASNIDHQATVYFNDFQLAYYSQHLGNKLFAVMRNQSEHPVATLQPYQYAALRLRKNQKNTFAENLNQLHATIIKTFSNDNGDAIVIYKMGS